MNSPCTGSSAHLQVIHNPLALWTEIQGPDDALAELERILDSWTSQLCPDGARPVPVHYRAVSGGIRVLTGCAAWLYATGALREPEDASMWRTAEHGEAHALVARLEAAGLLRGYQAQAVSTALDAVLGRSIIQAPPGAGKTRIAAALAMVCGGRWLYLVHNRELIKQAKAEIEAFTREVLYNGQLGVTAFKTMLDLRARVRALTYNQAAKDKLWDEARTGPAGGIVVDEVHKAPAKTRAKTFAYILPRIHGAKLIVGLSGTPLDRMDGKNAVVVGLTGPVVSSITRKELEAANSLAPVRYARVIVG